MIDEELYQQAADELNSDKRRPALWARACALASDDHDEARFLYTNLRVEELLAERAGMADNPANGADGLMEDEELPLTLMPVDTPQPDTDSNIDTDFDAADDADSLQLTPPDLSPEPLASVRSGADNPDASDDMLAIDAFDSDNPNNEETILAEEPDPDLMSDYVPEQLEYLEDTYANEGTIVEEFSKELASFQAEESSKEPELDLESVSQMELDAKASDQAQLNPADLDKKLKADIADDTFADPLPDSFDLTRANLAVLDEHTNDLDAMLSEARENNASADEPSLSDDEVDWLARSKADQPLVDDENLSDLNESVIEPDDILDEFNRQADELDLGDDTLVEDNSVQQELEKIQNELNDEETVSVSIQEPDDNRSYIDGDAYEHALDSTGTYAEPDIAPEPEAERSESGVIAAGAAAAAVAATAAMASTRDQSSTRQTPEHETGTGSDFIDEEPQSDLDFPLDLTQGRKGKHYSIYRRNTDAQAVHSGVSWSALFLTLPYLLYRQLFGTAIAYSILWIVAIGGLIVSALAWLDAGNNVEPIVQACTIGFGLVAIIGLLYLPFRYGNIWRSEKLEERGFELVATTKAKNPGRAIARARRHAAFE